jgi:hypothetical protein
MTMFVFEVTTTLSTAQDKIDELEKEMKVQKDNISIEFLKVAEEKEKSTRKRLKNVIQVTMSEITLEFERMTIVVETLHT